MSRTEFSSQVRKDAWKRCKGRCEELGCGAKLQVGHYQFDHIIPDGLGGKPTLENCAVLCSAHHSRKTHEQDRPMMQKADNIRAKHFGFAAKSGSFRKPPGFKHSWGKRS